MDCEFTHNFSGIPRESRPGYFWYAETYRNTCASRFLYGSSLKIFVTKSCIAFSKTGSRLKMQDWKMSSKSAELEFDGLAMRVNV